MKFCTNLLLISAFWLISSISVASEPSPNLETLQNNSSPLQLVQLDRPVKLRCFYRQNYQSDMSIQSDTIVLDYLFSHISFKKTSGESVRFSASDLAFVAQTIVDNKKPAQTKMIGVPEYAKYEKEFLDGINSFRDLLLEKYAKHYVVELRDLKELLKYHSLSPWAKIHFTDANINTQKKILEKQKPDEALLFESTELSDTASKTFIPPYISIEGNIDSWRDVARQVGDKAFKKELKEGEIENIWLLIDGRLILLRINQTEGKPFYVSDHGKLDDVIKGRLSSLIYENEENNDSWELRNFVPWYVGLTPEQRMVFKSDFIRLYDSASRKPAELIYFLSCEKADREVDIRGAIQIGARTDFAQTEALASGVEPDVFLEVLFDFHIALIKERGTQFFEQFHKEFLCGQSEVSSFLKGIMYQDDYSIFMSLDYLEQHMKNALKGRHEGLIRPETAFGSQKDGAKYREFAFAIPDVFDDSQSQKDIAGKMRAILQGKKKDEINELNFLPNLTAAWFIAENVRNSRTMLYNLILLDLVESGATLEYCDKNLYSWKYLLIHPLKPKRDRVVQVLDLFGKRYDLEKSFDGTHPMTHGDSSTQGKSKVQKPGLNSKVTLNPVQQKEAHLLIHWLQLILSCDSDLSGYVVEIEKGFLAETDFDDIDKLNKLGKKVGQNNERWILLAKIKKLIEDRLSSLNLTSSIQSPVIPITSTLENTNIYPCLSSQILCYPAIDSEKPFLCTKDRNLEFRINSNGIQCYCKVGLCEYERKTKNNLSYKIVNEIKTMCKLSQDATWELTPFRVSFFWGQDLEWIFLDAVLILFQDVE